MRQSAAGEPLAQLGRRPVSPTDAETFFFTVSARPSTSTVREAVPAPKNARLTPAAAARPTAARAAGVQKRLSLPVTIAAAPLTRPGSVVRSSSVA